MKTHAELNKLVVVALDTMNKSGIQPTARELYQEVRHENCKITKNGFRSFVKVINSFPQVEMKQVIGKPALYVANV